MTSYIALIRKDPDSDYSVDFPDFPGCITAGRDLDEARRLAGEALAFHVRGMQEDGDAIPAASSLEMIMQDQHNRDAVGFLVDLPVQHSPSVRINVMLPKDLIDGIDRVTKNRSRFLAEAARAKLEAA